MNSCIKAGRIFFIQIKKKQENPIKMEKFSLIMVKHRVLYGKPIKYSVFICLCSIWDSWKSWAENLTLNTLSPDTFDYIFCHFPSQYRIKFHLFVRKKKFMQRSYLISATTAIIQTFFKTTLKEFDTYAPQK